MSATESATATQTPLPTGTWKVDPVHSSVEFQVKHLGIATVKGQFTEFEGTLEVTPDGVSAHGSVERRERRHARAPARRTPALAPTSSTSRSTPRSRSPRRPSARSTRRDFEIEGDFTIARRHATAEAGGATLEGTETDPQGNQRVGLSATAQINRSDYDMKFNMALGSGNVVVGDKVKILLDISAVKAA